MKPSMRILVQLEPLRLWSAALVGCLLVPLAFLALVRQSSPPSSFLNLQVSIVHSSGRELLPQDAAGGHSLLLPTPDSEDAAPLIINKSISQPGDVEKPTPAVTAEEEDTGDEPSGRGPMLLAQQPNSSQKSADGRPAPSVSGTSRSPSPSSSTAEEEDAGEGPSGRGPMLLAQHPNSSQQSVDGRPAPLVSGTSRSPSLSSSTPGTETRSQQPAAEVPPAQEGGKIICDLSQIRTDFCDVYGDVRIKGSSSSVVLVAPSPPGTPARHDSWRIRPYARKWETALMPHIKEFSVTRAAAAKARGGKPAPRCTVHHSVPAVVFSTGGLQGNIFHEMADVLIPLFLTSHRYHGEVQFLITQYRASWVSKFRPMLRRLSRYELINADADDRLHCFPQATVGLLSHQELGIDPAKPPLGYSMADFRRFLRQSFSLKREYPQRRTEGRTKRPRLLFLSRRGSRTLLNEREVIRMARGVGYKVVVAAPEATRDLSRFARVVNSCDVLVGVHGAGLTNMLFLPANGTMVQVVPYGDLKYAVRFSYGDPAVGMGLRYLEYEVGLKESSLVRQYPRDHPVLRDPMSVHRKGFPAVWSTYIDKQNVTVDVSRFRQVLLAWNL